MQCEKLGSSAQDFEEWGYNANCAIDEEAYLAASLACWLRGRVFVDSSTADRAETFLMAMEMARGKRYSLAVPYLAWAYRSLRELQEALERVPRTYKPCALVLGWLGSYFP